MTLRRSRCKSKKFDEAINKNISSKNVADVSYLQTIFLGKDTKLMMNSGKSKFKRTSLDRFLNILIMGVSSWFPFQYTFHFS